MSKKNRPGRNDPCWCGSEIKFKKCHLNRSSQAPLTRADLESSTKRISSTEKCSINAARRPECSEKIAKAHTISKSASLKLIAENGQVMGTKPSLAQLIKTNGVLSLTSVAIKRASTFTGFCTHHDKTLFSPIEDKPITLSDEQLFLLAYRSIARELYAKEGNSQTAETLRKVDRGRTEVEQVFIQGTASQYNRGVNLALTELNKIKNTLDELLTHGDFKNLNHFVVEFSQLPSVLVSASTQPEFDFLGNRLQQFGSSSAPMSHIIFNCISFDQTGCFVFSWIHAHDAVCTAFTESLFKLGAQEIGNALVRFSYSFSENTWASPKWWRSLDKEAKIDISARLQEGVFLPHSPRTLTPNNIEFGAFHVDRHYYRRSKNSTQPSKNALFSSEKKENRQNQTIHSKIN